MRRLLALGWRYRSGCLRVALEQWTMVALALAIIGLTGLGIDVIRHHLEPDGAAPHWPFGLQPSAQRGPLHAIAVIAGLILLTAAVHAVVKYRAAVSSARLVQSIVVTLRSDVYAKLQRLSFRFYDANQSGSIINRVAGDVQAVRMFVDGVVVQLLSVLLSLSVYLAYMLSVHVPLTLLCLSTTPLLWVGAVWFSRLVRPGYEQASVLTDQIVLTLSENVQGMHVIKGFAREEEEIEKFQYHNGRIADQKHAIFRTTSIFQPLMGFLTQINMIVLLAYGGYLVIQGQLLLGAGLFVFANLLQQFANQVGHITNIANSVQASLTGARRVFEVLDAREEVQSRPQPILLPRARGEVEFDNVSFGYDPANLVLRNVSFRVDPGQCIALIGPTGAGKSTLLSLLPRFYDVLEGSVRIDGHDVRDLKLEDLRRSIGLVFQESFLFSHTVAANIAFGHPEATPEQIERAARIAAAHDFIRDLPQGYDTLVGEHGCNLSGGQRQRLAIARAVLLDPAILILDDATAAIDPETEHEIMEAMESAMQGRTTFVSAHRLSTLRRADQVLVFDRGEIVERGTHLDLARRGGHYHRAVGLESLESASIMHLPLAGGGAR